MKTNWRLLGIVAIAILGVVLLGLLQPIRPTIIISNSMEPLLMTDSVVFVNNSVSFDELKKGDIIRYTHEKHGPVMHRIQQVIVLDTGETVFMTKGDNNAYIDDWLVTEGMYTGKIIGGWNWTQVIIWTVFGDFSQLSQIQMIVRGLLLGIALITFSAIVVKAVFVVNKKIKKYKEVV